MVCEWLMLCYDENGRVFSRRLDPWNNTVENVMFNKRWINYDIDYLSFCESFTNMIVEINEQIDYLNNATDDYMRSRGGYKCLIPKS